MKRAEHHIVDRRKGNAGASVVMERSELLKRLEHVEQQLWQVTELIARQRKIIAELGAMGGDTDPAQIMLQRQENLLIFHLQERERLRAELATLNGCN